MECSQKYHYHPLSVTSPSIRCVRLLPTSETGELNLTIQEHSLEAAAGQYEAISYTWGTDEPSHPIRLNGKLMILRRNIWNFLKHYQTIGTSSPTLGLWIDSICINQDNVEEKNVQVKQMRQTFQQARRVLVWLGNASADNILMQHYQNHGQLNGECRLSWHDFLAAKVPVDLSDSSPHVLRDSFHRVLHNDYWRRLWIVQEIALARSAIIILGTSTIDIDDLADMAFHRLQQIFHGADEEDMFVFRPEHSDIMVIEGLVELHRSKDTQSLSHLTLKFHEHLCRDPRDKIYGLLGLMKEEHMFEVDYDSANEVVFAQAARCLAAGDPARGVPSFSCRLLMQELKVNPVSCADFEQTRHSRGDLLTELDTTVNVGWRVETRYQIVACEAGSKNCKEHVQFNSEGSLLCPDRLLKRAAEDVDQIYEQVGAMFECSLDGMSTLAVLSTDGPDNIVLECLVGSSMYSDTLKAPKFHLPSDIHARVARHLSDHTSQVIEMFQGKRNGVLIPASILELVYILDQHIKVRQESVTMQQKLDATAGISRLANLPNLATAI